jgi:hypothetical protein
MNSQAKVRLHCGVAERNDATPQFANYGLPAKPIEWVPDSDNMSISALFVDPEPI